MGIRNRFTKKNALKKIIIAAWTIALMTAAQTSFANAATGKGLEVAGIPDPRTRNAKADRTMKHAEKKELKSDAKELKAVAKDKTKKAAGVD